MKKKLGVISIILFLLPILYISLNAFEGESNTLPSETKKEEIKITPELEQKFPVKAAHAKLSLSCVFCHEQQGNDPEEWESVEEDTCLTCHKSKEYLADRLAFMDTLKANPHNSIHDGPNLSCDECHNEHIPSENMCAECHEKEIKENIWMRKMP